MGEMIKSDCLKQFDQKEIGMFHALNSLLEYDFFNFEYRRHHDTENHNRQTDHQSDRVNKLAGDQDKNNKPAGDKAQVVFGKDSIVRGQIRRFKGSTQGARQHVEVGRDNQSAAKNTAGECRRKYKKSDAAGYHEQNPVCPGNEI